MIVRSQATPNLNVAGAYVSGDACGAGVLTFSNIFSGVSSEAKLLQVTVSDLAKQSIVGDLFLLNKDISATTTVTDNGALDITDSDMQYVLGVVPIPAANYAALNDNSIATVQLTNFGLRRNEDGRNIFGIFVTRGTPTYTNGDLLISLVVERG